MISSTYKGLPVTSIDDQAFLGCGNLASVTIPDSVTSISASAFSGCSNLQFNEYGNAKYLGSKTNDYFALIETKSTNFSSYTIHNDTKIIANSAFSDCDSLTSITFNGTVEEWNAIEKGGSWNENIPAEKSFARTGKWSYNGLRR